MKLFYLAFLIYFIALSLSLFGIYLCIISDDYFGAFLFCFSLLVVTGLGLVTFKEYKKW